MKKIRVNLKKRSYDIVIGYGIINQLGSILHQLAPGRDAVIITNHTIYDLYGRHLQAILNRSGFTAWFKLVPDSERSKSQNVCMKLINEIAAYDRNKQIFLIAFGGGVIGDLTGFIASIYKRGINYVQIPTTFLSQVDSGIGGKTGIDLELGKNLVGTFYQPRIVLSDISFLKSLSLRQIRDGFSEVIKYGVAKDSGLFEYVEKNYKKILQLNIESLEKIIYGCSVIKARIVQTDETDKTGRRAVLNLGHTIGHAIEAAASFKKEYSHGEAVAIGMICACEISRKLKMMSLQDVKRVERIISNIGLPSQCAGLHLSDIMSAQSRDKKFIHGKNRFVLPVKIGSVVLKEGIPVKLIEVVIKQQLK